MDKRAKAHIQPVVSPPGEAPPPTLPGNDQPLQSVKEADEKDPRILREKLDDAEERLGFVLESIQDLALLLLDVDGVITGWSAGAEEILGFAEKDILGQRVHRIFTPEDIAAKIPEQEMELARTKGRATDDRWHLRKDGSRFWAMGYMRPLYLFETNKQLRGYAKLVRDLTAVKRTEDRIVQLNKGLETRVAERTRELDEANKELRKEIEQRKVVEAHLSETNKFEAIGRLAGGVAHDFNNQITGIAGIAASLIEETRDSHTRGELSEIAKAAQKAALLTRQLLAIGRQQVVTNQVINLNDLIADASVFYKGLLREDIEMVTRLDPAAGNVRANSAQIQQVLNNLLLNAQDAMPSGGKLEIQTANVILDESYVNQHFDLAPGPHVVLSVTDFGCGMGEQTLAHIFEPFFTTKEAGKGSGLGLAAVYGIVSQSGGDIAVTSQPGVGTTVRILLPQASGAVTIAPLSPAPAAELGTGETILVVEDEELVRRVITRTLEKRGYHVLQAGNAKMAIALASRKAGKIDLMLTDVVMPGMNGRELADALAIKLPRMAVLYTSGHSQDIVLNRGIRDSSIDFIEKPFSADALGLRIREVLDKRPALPGPAKDKSPRSRRVPRR